MRLLVIMLCCFVAAPIVRADQTEDAVIKAIKQLGGKVEQNGKVVDLSSTRVTDAQLKELAALEDLTTLDLSDTRVTGAGIKELAALKNLTTLRLRGPGKYISDPQSGRKPLLNGAGVKELAALKNLTTLDIAWTNVTDAGLKELAALNNLTALNLTRSDVTDAALKGLATLKNLRTLDLTRLKGHAQRRA
jgi:internalin A